jgi:hypothetical protein
MRGKFVVAAFAFAAATAGGASAQTPNSDWSLGGGVGVGRHGTGFNGTSGDPNYSGTSRPPTLRDYGPTPGMSRRRRLAGGPIYAPAAPSYTPPSGAPLEYYNGPSRR